MRPEARLSQLGLQLPPVSKPKGLYRPVVVVGNMAYVAGHLPVRPDGSLVAGRGAWIWTKRPPVLPRGRPGCRCWHRCARNSETWTGSAA